MLPNQGTVVGEFYVQLKPEFNAFYTPELVTGLKAVRLTQSKPKDPESGSFVIKVKIEADKEMFAIPEVKVMLQGAEAKVALEELQSWIAKP